jgi:hypothetical protein
VRIWPPIFVPPLLFLILQSLNYAIEPWACENQLRYPLHLTAAATLAIVLVCAALAWSEWVSAGVAPPDDRAGVESRTRFLAMLGLMLSVFSAVAVIALWLTQFIVPLCVR